MIDVADVYGLVIVNLLLIPLTVLAASILTTVAVVQFAPLHLRRSAQPVMLSLVPVMTFGMINFLLVVGSIAGDPLSWLDIIAVIYLIILAMFLIQGLAMFIALVVWSIRLLARRHRRLPRPRPQVGTAEEWE